MNCRINNCVSSRIKNLKIYKGLKENKLLAELINNAINKGLRAYSKNLSRKYDIRKTIIISGVHRGGTTWLLEILLNSLPLPCGISEPLSLTSSKYQDKRIKELNFSPKQYIEVKQDWKDAEALMKDVLTGANINLFNVFSDSILEYFKKMTKSNIYIVKFCRANRMLEWMVNKFKLNNTILLIRHPCAVVASQLSHGGWNNVIRNSIVEYPVVNQKFVDKEPWVKKIIKDCKAPEEKLALTWCLDFFIPLSVVEPHPWILTSYEKLVQNGEEELNKIIKRLGYKTPKDINKYLEKPSSSTRFDSNVTKGRNRLSGWKEKLDKGQIERILAIVSKFGLDFYTDDLEPDYERLYNNPMIRKG
ncbi:sulfotransferase domain-containing protein [Thermodesulfobacteriota bacterium]